MLRLIGYGVVLILTTSCDAVAQRAGLEHAEQKSAHPLAEAKAVGAACREIRRALEDCYAVNQKLPASGIFEGWRDMDAYIRDNQIAERPPRPADVPNSGSSASSAAVPERYTDQDKQPERKSS